MGYIYNERTGEFTTISQLTKSILLWPVKWMLAPLLFFTSLLRRLFVPFAFLKRLFPSLASLLMTLLVIVWRIFKKVAGWVFYPVIKWCEIAKETIGDRDWFFLVVWCLPGLFLYMIYSPIVLYLLEVLFGIVIWVLELFSLLFKWFKGVIK